MCSLCGTFVSASSKHCGRCNRCVAHFDHHCKWLNNCIGDSNYFLFICTIVATGLFEAVEIAFDVIAFCYWENDDMETKFPLVLVHLILSILAEIGIFQLILMHIYLRCRHMTTYEFLLSRRLHKAKVINT